MNPLEAAVLVALIALPFHFLVLWQLSRLDDPAYLRAHGIVVVRESALDGHSQAIGELAGSQIWATVTFKGMEYRFDHVAQPAQAERTRPGELYLDPGLVYVLA